MKMDISKYISDLLFEYECVIVPGLGGFVTNYRPATIHPVQHLFRPPAKTVLFNAELTNNDGLLAGHIAGAENIPFAQALEALEAFAKDTLAEIRAGKRVKLASVGELYSGVEGTLLFDQDEKINYLKASYGLGSFISPAISRKYRKTVKSPEPVFIDRRDKKPVRKRKELVTLMLILLPLMILFGWVTVKTGMWNGSPANKTSLVPGITEQVAETADLTPQTNPDGIADISNAEADMEGVTTATNENTFSNNDENHLSAGEIPFEKTTVIPETETIKTQQPENERNVEAADKPSAEHTSAASPVITQKMYYLIGGSFASDANAEKQSEKYRSLGYENSRIIGRAPNGFFRVSIAAYQRKNEALAELRKIRESVNPHAWVLRK